MTRRFKGERFSRRPKFVRLSMKNQCQCLDSDNKPKFEIAFPSYRHFAVIQAIACSSILSSRQFVAYPCTFVSQTFGKSLYYTHPARHKSSLTSSYSVRHRCSCQSDPRHPVTLSFKSSTNPLSRTSNRGPASPT